MADPGGAFGNLKLVGVVVLSVVLQGAILQVPWAQRIFDLTALEPTDYVIAFALGLVPVTVIELLKLVRAGLPALRRASA